MSVHTFTINSQIDSYIAAVVEDNLRYMDSNTKTVRVNISSRGGDYIQALSIYNMLRESRKKIVTSAQGFVGSAGAFILLAGDVIECASNAVLMFHMPEFITGEPMNADEMEQRIESMRAVEESLITSLCGRTKKSKEDIRNFLKKEEWMTPAKAQEMGLLDKILPFKRRKVSVSNDAPAEILNFVEQQNQEIELMSLKQICEKFNIKVADDANDEQITNAITAHIESATKGSEEGDQKPQAQQVDRILASAGALQPSSGSDKSAEKPKLPAALMKSVLRARKTEITALVNEGRITAAVGKDLEAVFTDENQIVNFVTDDGDISDSFDSTMDALRKNERVLNFDGKHGTGVQVLSQNNNDNPLMRDAESRVPAKS